MEKEIAMIEIPQNIIDSVLKQLESELPNEGCGLLTGNGNTVKQRYALTNIDRSPEHYSFDPQEQFKVLKEARTNGQQIIANYHSHPETPARPSEEDIRLAYDPDIIYIIVSFADEKPDIKAFSIANNFVKPVEIKVV